MGEYLVRCPICREQIQRRPDGLGFDCPALHRATTSPDDWRFAQTRMLLDELEAYEHPSDEVTDHAHRWVTIENNQHESVEECLHCAVWRMAPPQRTS